jgi:hypothetical protein
MRYLLIVALIASCIPASAAEIGNNTVCFVLGPDDCAVLAATEIRKRSTSSTMPRTAA